MEHRALLSTITWNSAAHPLGGSWDTPGNWVGGAVPGPSDDAVINLTASGSVNLNSNKIDSVKSVTTNSNSTLSISSGSLTIGSSSTLGGGLRVTGGVLQGAGTLSVSGTSIWKGGTIASPITNAGSFAITPGSSSKSLGGSLTNTGVITVTDDIYTTADNLTIDNQTGGTFDFQTDNSLLSQDRVGHAHTGLVFNNAGNLMKSSGSGTSTINYTLNDTGTLSSPTGTLELTAGGSASAVAFLTGTVAISAGTFALSDGSSTGATGTLQVDNGTLALLGSVTLSNVTIAGGTLTGPGTINPGSQVNWSDGELLGPLTNAGNLQVAPITYFPSFKLIAGTLINLGTITVSDDIYTGANGTTINNQVGGTFDFEGDRGLFAASEAFVDPSQNHTGLVFNNSGALTKSAGSGRSEIDYPVTNTGTLSSSTGILDLTAGGSGSGVFSLTGVVISGGTFTLGDGSSVQNITVVDVEDIDGYSSRNGTLKMGNNVTISNLYIRGGVVFCQSNTSLLNVGLSYGFLKGGTIASGSQMDWAGGTISDLTNAGTLTANGGGGQFNDMEVFGTLTNLGTIVVLDNIDTGGDGTTINNQAGGNFVFENDSSLNDYAWFQFNPGEALQLFFTGLSFNNAGTIEKAAGTQTSTVSYKLTNTGSINVQAGAIDQAGEFTNFDATSSTLTGGTYVIAGYFDFTSAKINVNKANISLSGASADIRDLTGSSAFGGFATNFAGASLALQGNRSMTVGAFTNAGSLAIGSGSTFTSPDLTNSGTLAGSGVVAGNVTNTGQTQPGGAGVAGMLTVTGNFTQTSAGSLIVEIGGPALGTEFDRLSVSGTATLNGTLTAAWINNYVPAAGLAFRALTFTSKTGDFSTRTGLNVGPATLTTVYDATGMNLADNVAPAIPAANPVIGGNGVAKFSLTANDPETSASALVFTITSLPATGTLTTSGGIAVTVGQTFTGSPVSLVYRAPSFIFGDFTASFGFTVRDTGTPIGVVATSAAVANLSLAGPSAGVASIFGASGNNTILAANSGGNLQVTLNGVVNNTGVPINSITHLNVVGGSGNDVIEVSGLAINSTLRGGAGTNTFVVDGTSGNDTFSLSSSTSLGFNGATITATSPLTINGMGGNDVFNVLASNVSATIHAGSGDDTFALANGASITTPINGGGGSNTIDESAVTKAISLNLPSSTLSGLSIPFANIQTILGGANRANALTGPSAASTYNITGTNAGNEAGIAFTGFGNLNGGAGNDIFKFGDGATLTGSINGGGGINSVDMSAYTAITSVNLSAARMTGVGGFFSSIQSFAGGSNPANKVYGPNTATTFQITGANVETVQGIGFRGFGFLAGGTSNDSFVFSDGASLTGSISGGGGTDTLDLSSYTTAVKVNLATSKVTGIGGIFSGLQSFIGGSNASNGLTGPAAASTYNITGANAGNVAGFSFAKFGSLVGGSADDVFKFAIGGALSGAIDGNGGTNTIDESAITSVVTVNLATASITLVGGSLSNIRSVIGGSALGNRIIGRPSASTYTITGTNAGNAAGIVFAGFGNITGGAGNDTFKFGDGATLTGSINGGGGTNSVDMSAYTAITSVNLSAARMTGLGGFFSSIQSFVGGSNLANKVYGPNTATTFQITGANVETVQGIGFRGFGFLAGGTSNDSFVFSDGASLTGSISGGGGTDTLDLSSYTTAVNVNLATSKVTGIGGIFSGLQSFIGGSNASNGVTGPAAATSYNITALNTFNATGLNFSGFRKIIAGAGEDSFILSNGAGLSGAIDGGGGNNWLDYSAYTTNVNVNLATNAATGFGSAIGNIMNVRGGSGNDKLTGNSQGNILIGGSGNDTLIGGSGRSILIGGTGVDAVTGGSGDDIVIGGSTTFDNNISALDAILAEWRSTTDDYTTRINFIKNGGGLNGSNMLNLGTTVVDDLTAEILTGGAGKDWFFKGTNDTITDLQSGELVN